ncbi:MAG: protein-disulfide reductase DsbD family protein [Geminicoccaceae bacterium]
MRFLAFLAFLALGLGLIGANATHAQVAVDEVLVDARLISEQSAVQPGEVVWVGLHQRIAEGWHTYWSNPGDSGAPTRLEWRLPDGVSAGSIAWPLPERLPYGTLVNYGYEGEVLLSAPIEVPADWPAGTPLPIAVDAHWLVCADVCIPESESFAIELVTGTTPGAPDPTTQALFESTRQYLPQVSEVDAAIEAKGSELALTVAADVNPNRVDNVYFFPFEGGIIDHAAPQPYEIGDGVISLSLTGGSKTPEGAIDGVLVLAESLGRQSFPRGLIVEADVSGLPAAAPRASWQDAGAGEANLGLAMALILAFAGGIVLNLMPCVFPVLSMKAIALASHRDAPRREATAHGLAYTGGVVASFVALAFLLIGVQAAGAQVGWGFQLQSPVVVMILAYVLFAVGLNLSGLFELGGILQRWGGSVGQREGLTGSALTGVLAVIVAAPCTAPFMATAIGFALAQPAPVTLIIFASLGLGLALPFLLLSMAPGATRWLPRPGIWMDRLKQGLAFPMYASAAWLVWVLSQQAGPTGVLTALLGMVLIAFAAWVFSIVPTAEVRGQWLARAVGLAAVVAALFLVTMPRSEAARQNAGQISDPTGLAAPFSNEAIDQALAAGQTVFVNMTAAWCVTCQVNDRVALRDEAFSSLIRDQDILYLKGDWTNQDPEITAFLSSFGRSGVPLYVVLPGDGRTPMVLPQLLTGSIVRDALTG